MEPKIDLPLRRVETPRLGNRATYKLKEPTKLYKGEQVVLDVSPDTLEMFEQTIKPRLADKAFSDGTIRAGNGSDGNQTSSVPNVQNELVQPETKRVDTMDFHSKEVIDACIIYHLKNECLSALQVGAYTEQIHGHSLASNAARVRILTLMGENMRNWVRSVVDEKPQLLSILSPNAVLRTEMDWGALKQRVTELLGNTKNILADGPIPDAWLDRAKQYYPTLDLGAEFDPELQIVKFGSGKSDITPLVGAPDDEILPQYVRSSKKPDEVINVGSLQGTTYISPEQNRKLLEKIAEQKKKYGRQD